MDSLPLMTLVSVYFSLSYNVVTAPTVPKAGPEALDGELFIQKIANGEVISETPRYLLFTAPYKLTTCSKPPCQKPGYPNLVMAFPAFIGDNKNHRRIFSTLYPKDADDMRTLFKTSPDTNRYTTIVCENTTCETYRTLDPKSRSTAGYYGASSDAQPTKPTFRLAYDPRRTVKEAQGTKRPAQTKAQLLEMRESDYNI